jgi:hydrogenase maturation protein HypF
LSLKSFHITVTGLVQGVGFRPFIFRIARKNNLSGWVRNTNENVLILVTGEQNDIDAFLASLNSQAPGAAVIEEVLAEETVTTYFTDFSILKSHDLSDEITEISPDIAVCDECLHDMDAPGLRHNYPLVNCTNCGPRFTIIKELPYDRAKTTMRSFAMCPDCRREYETITDRRFHAQPIACNACGPEYEMYIKNNFVSSDPGIIATGVSKCLMEGGLALIKGVGGMHLACDAFNETAVRKIREIKKRDGKPFAVLFRDTESLRNYADLNESEEIALTSWRKPIVLLESKKSIEWPALAASLNAGLNLLGVMLPYMPFHYLLFKKLKTTAIVLTSGNFSSEPIIISNEIARQQFNSLVDLIVLHNRNIYNRTDDSVVRFAGGKERVFRRSRGYVPSPVRTALNTEGILAFGAELTNCFCVGRGSKAFLSQHIGDLQTVEAALFYEEVLAQFLKLFRIKPALLAVDMHPSYISTKTGLAFGDFPIVHVQHHHAHIASCMAEYRLNEKVIGVAFDGTGFGTDGNTWGSEFMICDLHDFRRISHFEYIPLPGGDAASEEPWRVAVSWLYKVYGEKFTGLNLPFLNSIDAEKIRMIISMIDKKINSPLSSGAGRLFDAVASLLDLVQVSSFQAEGPMRLEALVLKDLNQSYSFSAGETIFLDQLIQAIVEDIIIGISPAIISTKFHNTILLIIFDTVSSIRLKEGLNKVVLSGGVFQNKYLLERTTELLEKSNFEVWSNTAVPANDGGIALGQLAIASERRKNNVSGHSRKGS